MKLPIIDQYMLPYLSFHVGNPNKKTSHGMNLPDGLCSYCDISELSEQYS